MTPADQARAMGDYIREHGFSPGWTDESVGPHCGCFAHASYELTGWHEAIGEIWIDALRKITGAFLPIESCLIAAGYASDADRSKAVEACYAAARMLEGKS